LFAAGNVWHRPFKRVASATGKGAIAIQFRHEYLQPLGSGRHPPRRDELIAGYLRLFCTLARRPGCDVRFPGTVLVMNSAPGGGPGMSHGMPAPGDPDGQHGSEPDLPATGEFGKMRAVMRASEKHREGGVDPELKATDADPGPDT
jgi:hypothetical protein